MAHRVQTRIDRTETGLVRRKNTATNSAKLLLADGSQRAQTPHVLHSSDPVAVRSSGGITITVYTVGTLALLSVACAICYIFTDDIRFAGALSLVIASVVFVARRRSASSTSATRDAPLMDSRPRSSSVPVLRKSPRNHPISVVGKQQRRKRSSR